MMSYVSKSWCFTLNNYTENDEAIIQAWEKSYLVYGRESPEGGTPHLQGFITFTRAYRLPALKKMCPRAHWEPAKTSDAANYCMKDGDFYLEDNRKKKGRGGAKLEELCKFITDGGTVNEAWAQFSDTMVKHYKGIELLAAKTKPKTQACAYATDSFRMKHHEFTDGKYSVIFQGEPGTGKTQFALSHFNHALCVTHMDDLRQFDPEVHDGIVFDDMDFNHLPRSTQIFLADADIARTIHCRYENAVIPPKTKKIFTTNLESLCFSCDDGAIKRRLTIYRFGGAKLYK